MNKVEQLYGKTRLLKLLRVWHPKTQWFEPTDQDPETIHDWIKRGAEVFKVRLKTRTSYVEPDIAAQEAQWLLSQPLHEGSERIVLGPDESGRATRLQTS